MRRLLSKRLPAFNLQEMLIVLAIIGILLLLVMPKFMTLITKAKSLEAQTQLKHIHNMQLLYSYGHSKFSPEFEEIDFEAPLTVTAGGNAKYAYEIIEASATTFKVRATAVVDFDRDGIFNVWEINEVGNPKQITKD